MIEIIPAVLERTLQDITSQLARVQGAAPMVQLDIADGMLVPNTTWPFAALSQRSQIESVTKEIEALPLWEHFDFEADVMVAHPEQTALQWVSAGFSRIVVHVSSAGMREALQLLQNSRGSATSFPIAVGIALSCDTTLDVLLPHEGLYDYVQVMGIAHVGVQGQEFDERALTLLSQLRQRYPGLTIQVDGGVSLRNARALAHAGANRLIAGSAIFASDDPKRMIETLAAEANRV